MRRVSFQRGSGSRVGADRHSGQIHQRHQAVDAQRRSCGTAESYRARMRTDRCGMRVCSAFHPRNCGKDSRTDRSTKRHDHNTKARKSLPAPELILMTEKDEEWDTIASARDQRETQWVSHKDAW